MDIQNEKHAVKLYFFLKKLELIEHISINMGLSEFIYFVKNTVADEIRRRHANTQVIKPGWNISISKPEPNIEVTPAELFTLVVLNNKPIFHKLRAVHSSYYLSCIVAHQWLSFINEDESNSQELTYKSIW